MSKVSVTKSLLDDLADSISAKSNEDTPLTLAEMKSAVDSIITGSVNLQDKTNINPSTSSQTIQADTGYDGLSSVQINAMPSGTAGTPTATKGAVSNHTISVTPSVTNTTGYITGSTKTGTAVTVTASELASGTKSITQNGTGIDVVGYSAVNVAVSGGDDAFIVTLSWDDTDELWIPNKTITELQNAYSGGEEIIFICDNGNLASWFYDDDYQFVFSVLSSENNQLTIKDYLFNTQGIEYCGDTEYILPNFDSPSVTYTPTESQQTETITYDPNDGYTGLEEVNVTVNAIPSNYVGSGITRRSSSDLSANGATVTAPSGYYASNATKTVASGTEGTPTATKGTVSNHSISVTPSVTNSAGYITGGTKNGTAVSVSASELVSGTLSVTSSGTKDVTNYASASIPAGTEGTPTASKGAVSNHSITVTPSVTNSGGYITGSTKTGTGVTVSASELVSGSQTITQNASNIDVTNLASVTVNVSGGGSSGMTVATATATPSSASSSISFTGLSGEPTSFVVMSASDLATGASPYKTATVVFDGTNVIGQTITNTSNAQVSYDSSGFSKSYSNGTLTITGTGTNFQANQYKLVYTYGGASSNIDTADVQVGSGATSITFTGLSDEPDYFSCIFKSNFATSNGYQRVIGVVYDGTNTYGMAMDSGANAQTSWSYSYSGGSLTISSSGTNNGGYFHQPGYYQLTYGVGGDNTLQKKTATPTGSDQTITADTAQGYTALQSVKVEGVVCDNLTADNIKNGVTVKIGTATDDDSVTAVTGTYSGGGGGGASIDTKTVTASNRPSSLSFTGMKGEPKVWCLKARFTMTSSSSTYYYVDSMRYNGTNTEGRLFRMGSTRQTEHVTSGYSYTYSGTTLTISSTGNRTTSPGCFYNGSYELVYVY